MKGAPAALALLLFAGSASAAPYLRLSISAPSPIDPGRPFELSIIVLNSGSESTTAHDVAVTLDLPDGVEPSALPAECAAAGRQIVCRRESLAASTGYSPAVFDLKLDAPPRYEGGELVFRAKVKAAEESVSPPFATEATAKVVMYRTFFVTTTADDGLGSLRTAAVDALALCPGSDACKIAFNIKTGGGKPWKTIRLLSPLPPIRAKRIVIDGATQSELAGTKNPDGPPVEISGGGTVAGDGLLLVAVADGTIANLTINGFRGNAISLDGGFDITIRDNFIGTDPTGSFAVPNYRGIGISTLRASGSTLPRITGNVISGNERSGIFALRGDYDVARNRIGLQAHADRPLPNGGSGIYAGQGVSRMEVTENAIAFNREMGVAVHPLADYIWIRSNTFVGNGGLAIDDGLDGPSLSVKGSIGVPVIFSAAYDPAAKTTTVRMSTDVVSYVDLFASDAPGDAQRPLSPSTRSTIPGPPLTQVLTFTADLRGKWITATATRFFSHSAADIYLIARTTELSPAVQVK